MVNYILALTGICILGKNRIAKRCYTAVMLLYNDVYGVFFM